MLALVLVVEGSVRVDGASLVGGTFLFRRFGRDVNLNLPTSLWAANGFCLSLAGSTRVPSARALGAVLSIIDSFLSSAAVDVPRCELMRAGRRPLCGELLTGRSPAM